MKKLILIDGNAIIHRAYHALPPFRSKEGELVNAVFGFARILLIAIRDMNPTHLCVAFDHPKPTFRHEEFKDYKAHREKMPDDLIPQIDLTKEIVKKLNIPKFDAALEKGNVIGDGLYSWSEYKVLKARYGENMKIIAVWAPPELRYERISNRHSDKNDTTLRNRNFSKEEAKNRDYAEIENIEKGGPIAMADYLLKNTGTKEELIQNAKNIIKRIFRLE